MFGNDIPLIANQLPISFDLPEDLDEWRIEMHDMVKRINGVVNTKEGGLYVPQEIATFQLYFTDGNSQSFRNTYRKTFDFIFLNGGTNLDPNTTYSFAHNIAVIADPTMLYGTATTTDDPVNFIPLPYSSKTTTKNIELFATPTRIVVITGSQTLSQCYVNFFYTKN